MAGLTRRRFIHRAAGAGVALAMPIGLLDAPPVESEARGARGLAARLLDDPPCRVPVGATAAAMAAGASCSAAERAHGAGDQRHDWGWGSTMGTTGGQHVVIDAAVVRAVVIGSPLGVTDAAGCTGSAHVLFGPFAPGTLDLRTAARGMTITGARCRELAGTSVAGAGDVNGDGLDDVIVGAPAAHGDVILGDVSAARGRGAAILVMGGRRRAVRVAGPRRVRLTGRDRGADTGYAVDGGGDVNGDGLSDIIVGAPQGNRTPFNTAGGGAFVVFGRRAPRSLDLRALGSAGIEIRGSGADWAGFAVASTGRVGGDRRDDVALLAHGSLAVVYGRRVAGTLRLDGLAPAAGYVIDGTIEPNQWYSDDASGGLITAAAVGGDADGDGSADLLAGVRVADHNDRPDSGSAYLFFGPPPPAAP